ncbi:MAG: hypothetical protein AAF517_08605 [Planctomycetota bacterium]
MISRIRTSLLLSLASLSIIHGVVHAAEWINDGSNDAPKLSVEQSIWAMGQLPRGGPEWSVDEKFARIAGAGFDGVMVWLPESADDADKIRSLAEKHSLAITLQFAPRNDQDVARCVASAKRLGARAFVGLVQPTFVNYTEGEAKIRALTRAFSKTSIPFYLETHRGTITQDLALTKQWAETIAGLRMHADLSHFVVSYGVKKEPTGFIDAAFDSIFARTGMIDGRVGNGQQVQIDIGPKGDTPSAKLFAKLWQRAMVKWLQGAKPGDVFVFKSELGPPPYSIVGPDGKELSDRWTQALVMRDLGIRTWNAAVKEAGKGQAYTGRKKPAVASIAKAKPAPPKPVKPGPKPKKPSDASSLLTTSESGVPVLRGDSFKIGDFHLAGQPLQPDFDIAKEKGIKSIINLRMAGELGGIGFDEKAYIGSIGLKYYHFEVGPDTIDDELAEKILKALDEAPKPCFIHDSNGNRVWGVWSLYLGVKHGIPVDKTEAVAKKHNIRRLVIDNFVRDYVERKSKKK